MIINQLLTRCRNQVWPRTPAPGPPKGEPHPVHALQLRRPAHLPAGHQLLQGCAIDQLPAALQGDHPQRLPAGGLDLHGCHCGWPPGVCVDPDPRLQSGKSSVRNSTFCPSRLCGSDADAVSRRSGEQVVESDNPRHVPCAGPVVHRVRHCHHHLRRRRRRHPDPGAPPAQGQHGQESRSYRHLPPRPVHDSLLGLPVSPD